MIGSDRLANRQYLAIPRILLLVALLCAPAAALRADFDAAAEAYRNQDYRRAYAEFLALAETGDARAQSVLAIMYKYGESVPIDEAEAFSWYLRAAEQDYPPAQYHAGLMLINGVGTEPDADRARYWLSRAADAGYDKARAKLAELDGDGGLFPNTGEPVSWSKRWNLRLPNEIRFNDQTTLDDTLRVYRVQLGAMSSTQAAQTLWQRLQTTYPAILGDKQPIFREVTTERGVAVYRLQLGPFSNRDTATAMCEALGMGPTTGCLVVFTH